MIVLAFFEPLTLGTAALIGGASLLGNLFGGLFGSSSSKTMAQNNLQAVRETNQANRELVEYQNEENLKRWHMQNAYDSPVAQMARYREANLNPYLMQADGAQSVSQSMPAAERATMQAYQQTENPGQYWAQAFSDMGQSVGNAVMQKYQMELMKANVIKTLADSEISKTQKEKLAAQMQATIDNLNKDTQRKDAEIKTMELQREVLKVQKDHENYKIFNTIEDTAYKNKLGQLATQELKNAITQNKLLQANINLSNTQQKLVSQQIVGQTIDNMWRKMGINPNDSSLANLAARYILNPEAFKDVDLGKNIETCFTQLTKGLSAGISAVTSENSGIDWHGNAKAVAKGLIGAWAGTMSGIIGGIDSYLFNSK